MVGKYEINGQNKFFITKGWKERKEREEARLKGKKLTNTFHMHI